MIKPLNDATVRYYLRVRYYFILTCHYGLLHNIIAYKQLQYIATYFSSKDFVKNLAIIAQACWAREVYCQFTK